MAYKVRRGDSWQTLSQQFPNLQQLNPNIKDVKPGVVLQTPFQYGSGGGLYGHQPPVVTPGRPPVAPPAVTYYAHDKRATPIENTYRYSSTGATNAPMPPPYYAGSNIPFVPYYARDPAAGRTLPGYDLYAKPRSPEMGDITSVQGWLNSPEGKAQFTANKILMELMKQYNSEAASPQWTPPAQGQPGYDRWAALSGILTGQQIAKKRARIRNTFAGASEADTAGDAGSFGQYNWRI